MKTVRELKRGEFFCLTESLNGRVYIRGEYDRSTKKDLCGVFDDISESRLFKGDRKVYTERTF